VIERTYIHIAGPKGAGKTMLAEAVLRAFEGPTIAVRCERDHRLAEAEETKGARDPEVRRYRAAGATGAARLRFTTEDEDGDSFFCCDVMSDYSTAVLIEGDCLATAPSSTSISRSSSHRRCSLAPG
jgi:molybdopterin-guanine dinucleotide biosynthesis protein